jgi:hypothetical protein
MRFLFLALLSASALSSWAIVRRDDVPDSTYTNAAVGLPIGLITYTATPGDKRSCVLINDQYILTAAHNFKPQPANPTTVRFGSTTYNIVSWIQHPAFSSANYLLGNDISVAKLDQRVRDFTPAPLYTGNYTRNTTLTLCGFGSTGTGLTGSNSFPWTARAGENAVDLDPDLPNIFLSDFDRLSPSANGLSFLSSNAIPRATECSLGFGDSGGPAFITFSGERRVAGINSGVGDQNQNSLISDYGDIAFFSKTVPLNTWINQNSWEPGRIDGKLILPNYTPTVASLRTASIKLYSPGGTTPLASYTVPLAINNGFSFVTPLRGSHDIRIEVPGFLAKRVVAQNITTTGPRNLSVTLGNGNCDGDLEVGPSDFEAIVANFGINTNDPSLGDLDGDLECGPGDFEIVVAAFGNSGDE